MMGRSIFYTGQGWFEAQNIKWGSSGPSAFIGPEVSPQVGDSVIAGLSKKGYSLVLEGLGMEIGPSDAGWPSTFGAASIKALSSEGHLG